MSDKSRNRLRKKEVLPCLFLGLLTCWLFILRLVPRETCGTRRNTSILRRRGCLPRSTRTRTLAASVFRHRMSVPHLGGCSLSPAGSRPSECFAGSVSGSLMPVDSRCQVNLHALRLSVPVPIVLQTLGSESTYPLSSLGATHLLSTRPLRPSSGSSGS